MLPNHVKGSDLSPDEQRHVLSRYVNRYTSDHKPRWAGKPRQNGTLYPVQFRSDQEWLENTWFRVTKSGKVHRGRVYCNSRPTWPNEKD